MANSHLSGVVQQLRKLAGAGPQDELSDGFLLERFALHREEPAFEEILRRHGPMVHGVCRRVLGNLADADDAFQATFLVFVRKARSIRKRRSVGSWLHGVAARIALRLKSQRRRQPVAAGVEETPAPGGTAAAEWRELRPLIDEELQRLPERYRVPVVLCYLEGKTNEEAARELRLPAGTVKSRLARARERLRARLTRRGVSLSGGALATALIEQARAGVPPALLSSTVQAVTATGPLPAPVAALVEGALRAMLLRKLTIAAALILMLGAFAAGAALVLAGIPAAANGGTAAAQPPQPPQPPKRDDLPGQQTTLLPLYPISGKLGVDMAGDLPMVTVGRVPDEAKRIRAEDVALGGLALLTPRAGSQTQLLLVGPPLNSGEDWKPALLTRKDKAITLVMESWQDNGPRAANVVSRPVHWLTLGHLEGCLEAGAYELHVVWRGFFRDVLKREAHYALTSLRTGSLKFAVAEADGAPVERAALRAVALKAEKVPAAEAARRWQPPTFRRFTMDYPIEEPTPPQKVQVGTADVWAWDPGQLVARKLPALTSPGAAKQVCAFIPGPAVNGGEPLTLREVEWKGRTAVLRVDLWRDYGPGRRDVFWHPLLAVPLQLPGQGLDARGKPEPGEYRVRVEWTLLRAVTNRLPYLPEDVTARPAARLLEVLRARSEAKFTVEGQK